MKPKVARSQTRYAGLCSLAHKATAVRDYGNRSRMITTLQSTTGKKRGSSVSFLRNVFTFNPCAASIGESLLGLGVSFGFASAIA